MANTSSSASFEAVDDRAAFIGGRRSLDFTATLRKRHAESVETLIDSRSLVRWLRAAGLLGRAEVSCTVRDLANAKALREAIYRAVMNALAGKTPAAEDVKQVNQFAAHSDLAPQLMPKPRTLSGTGPFQLTWAGRPTVSSALATIARDAVALMTTDALSRVKCCANSKCSLLFQDDSQARRRTWCSMERCGNRAKIAEYRKRKASSSSTSSC